MHPDTLLLRQALLGGAAAFVFAACSIVDQPVGGLGEVTHRARLSRRARGAARPNPARRVGCPPGHVVVEGPSCGTWGASTQQGENLVLMVPGTTHHVEVANSEVYHSGWHAGIAAGGDDIWILNNYIHDNVGFNDPDQYNTSHGI